MMGATHPRTEPRWWLDAACAGMDPALFVPDGHSGPYTHVTGRRIEQAKAVCARCPVGDECEADGTDDPLSIRNGKTPQERL